jgi:hypothetical protein
LAWSATWSVGLRDGWAQDIVLFQKRAVIGLPFGQLASGKPSGGALRRWGERDDTSNMLAVGRLELSLAGPLKGNGQLEHLTEILWPTSRSGGAKEAKIWRGGFS